MKKINFILLFAICFFLPVAAQQMSYNFDPNADYQFKAVNDEGEIYAIKFEQDKKKVKETMLIDLKKEQNRITYYDENGKPIGTCQGEKMYVYDIDNGKLRMSSSDQHENGKLLNTDVAFLKSQGINLGFMDEFVANNSNWLEVLSKTQKYVDWTMECVAGYETAVSCISVGVNPLMAVPCASGIIHFIGLNYNDSDPKLSGTMGSVSENIDYLNNYAIDGKPIDGWGAVQKVIDNTSEYYNDKKALLHEFAELVRKDIENEKLLKSEQKYEAEGDIDFSSIKNSGIIQSALAKIDALKQEKDKIDEELSKKYEAGKIKVTEEVIKKAGEDRENFNKKIIEIKKDAETQYNDSLQGVKKLYSWKKTDREGHYGIKKVNFVGIRWGKYDDKPYAKLELYFTSSPKSIRFLNFGTLITNKFYFRHLTFCWTDGKKQKEVKGMLLINKEFRADGKLDFTLRWDDFLATPTIVFSDSDFSFDYSMPKEAN